jgi:hypothetical protein
MVACFIVKSWNVLLFAETATDVKNGEDYTRDSYCHTVLNGGAGAREPLLKGEAQYN